MPSSFLFRFDFWKFAIVPAALGLFGLRFTRGARTVRGATFVLLLSVVPTVVTGVAALLLGKTSRIHLLVAVVLVVAIAVLANALSMYLAYTIIPMVEATG